MQLKKWLIGSMAVLAFGCAEQQPTDVEIEVPCGMRTCAATETDDASLSDNVEGLVDGKADTQGVRDAVLALTADGELNVDDVRALFDETGRRVSKGEIKEIRDALAEVTAFKVTDDALNEGRLLALTANLPDIDAEHVLGGETFGGTEIPEAVTELLVQARLNGAVVYDVNEVDNDGEQIWTPYPATTPATENMTFEYTEITPSSLKADMEDVDAEYQMITGSETIQHPNGFEYKAASYRDGQGGTGNILSHYDEVYHPDIYARGRSGQKWANNMAILSDGTIHCLPASRRSEFQDVILTNPHLSRDRMMMYNGHLDIREGVVVGVEMSGRLSKLAAKGKAIFIDPVALLKAWGFEVSPNVRLRYGNTNHGVPMQEDGVVGEAP